VTLQTLYAPYWPVVPFVERPEQRSALEPQIELKRLDKSDEFKVKLAVHDSDENMQSQRTEFGVGGRVSEAAQLAPVVGQERATVFVGVYVFKSIDEGDADAI
jgi:hypothetical protein